MSSVTIYCPKCTAGLKLPNRSLLGRKGKCPKCEHRFILEEPDEVQLELAEPESAPVASKPAEPMVGTSAKWIPDEPSSDFPPLPAATGNPRQQGQDVVGQQSEQFPFGRDSAFNESPVAGNPFDFTAVASNTPTTAGGSTHELDLAIPAGATSGSSSNSSVASRVRGRRTPKSRTGPIAIGIGTALFAFSMLGLWWQSNSNNAAVAQQNQKTQQPQKNAEWEQEKQELANSDVEAKSLSPTSGANIPMDFLPFTPHLICHLRPSEIWAAERSKREFIATLGALGQWLEAEIREMTGFEPQEIEELTFVVNFGPRTSKPDVAAVVRLQSEQAASDLQLNRFATKDGTPASKLPSDGNVFESDPYSYLVVDKKTFVVAPNSMSDLLSDARSFSREPSVELELLLEQSDRRRQSTLMFNVTNIDTHREYIFDEDMWAFADEFVLWFGKDVQTVSWSMHLDKDLFMETLLHESNESSPLRVQKHARLQLDKLPGLLENKVRFMTPSTQGYRAMIGRFPAMMQAFVLGTTSSVGASYVRLTTFLPDKAAANLAAASLFTWNQSVVTDFSGPSPTAASASAVPELVVDRLQMPVIVDFRRMPLQEAFAYVGDEIKTPISINGDALKLAGMTQNMPQTYDLGEVPAIKALDAMLSNPLYKGMLVIVVDEAKKSIVLTTRVVAEQSGLTIFDTSK